MFPSTSGESNSGSLEAKRAELSFIRRTDNVKCLSTVWHKMCNCSDPASRTTRPVASNRANESVAVVPTMEQPQSLYPDLYSHFYRNLQGQLTYQPYPTTPKGNSNLPDVVPADSDNIRDLNQGASETVISDSPQKVFSIHEMHRMRITQENLK